ncbi:hypothetical protein [Foetidibacter luteolus]|uniref:hypothetical protein n=1 Tax=Foetidibacter luteolus TaxID=2608880 RepID=UPI00129B638E|nr:hypothetical protein [Foetidibacter luteolus]
MQILLLLFLFFVAGRLTAQNLSFTQPVNFVPQARTDKAFDITNFRDYYFVAWKEPGKTGKIHVSCLGKRYSPNFSATDQVVSDDGSSFGPMLRVTPERIYLFWIAGDGSLKYAINNSDSTFDVGNVHNLVFENGGRLSLGVTTSYFNGKVFIASHGAGKNDLVYAIAAPDAQGILKDEGGLQTIAGKTSADYPFVVSLNNQAVRLSWMDKNGNVSFADYDAQTGNWKDENRIGDAKTSVSPAIYSLWNSGKLFYVWRGAKKDNRLYYLAEDGGPAHGVKSVLPAYFNTANPVSICNVDGNNFVLAYAGADQKLYLSYFSGYRSESWMQDLLMPHKASYMLNEIVLPGSHDAGMSVLSGIGGQQQSSINECNTLTQMHNIGKQLQAGLRMFDLRIGTYDSAYHTKHCSSDCMADAIGGGYGEPLKPILTDTREFLHKNRGEVVIFNFSHFCNRETPTKELAEYVVKTLGEDIVFKSNGRALHEVTLKDAAGKAIILFEQYVHPDGIVDSSAIADASKAFINWRRAYAATNDLNKLVKAEETFFAGIKDGVSNNDLIRLDWQLTESSSEAALVCNDFQSDKTSPIVNGAMFLTNLIGKHKSIRDLAQAGNNSLPGKVNEWLDNGTINKKNKPNILYVDVSGTWITDYCIDLNNHPVYNR